MRARVRTNWKSCAQNLPRHESCAHESAYEGSRTQVLPLCVLTESDKVSGIWDVIKIFRALWQTTDHVTNILVFFSNDYVETKPRAFLQFVLIPSQFCFYRGMLIVLFPAQPLTFQP